MPHLQIAILNIDPSLGGHVHLMGDVHGAEVFHTVLDQLNHQDTLIIVGDLIDRGFNKNTVYTSGPVLDRLIELKNNPEMGPHVYAIQGNHEVNFLKMLDILREDPNERDTIDNRKTLMTFFKNGGGWIFKHPDEKQSTRFSAWFKHVSSKTSPLLEKAERITRGFIDQVMKTNEIAHYLIDKIDDYETFIRELPYLIKLQTGDKVEWVVHADLNLFDEDLNAFIQSGEALYNHEIEDMMETRPAGYRKNTARNASSSIVWCGHNIINSCQENGPRDVAAIRAFSAHINLDVGAYILQAFIVMNQTSGEARVVYADESPIRPEDRVLLETTAANITAYYTSYYEQKLSAAVESDSSLSQVSVFKPAEKNIPPESFKNNLNL